ncbi:4-hydroxy-3-methylbut-2-en-1-yl diphosphate synthase [Candidatus Izimaplasma bacterium HR1]|jgi:(E)-4-hydroxy-3-methylbut-2-enyl-diphosphate synthase|uniref:flavodoxin-dependent (E)-4-hydroxy-3-methylbut-2-enyl-diphosphate synthase n=1 Tax=Candidatus Izimoplasma sp. HR1 TaxID=1541959 RepID=UPI0004F5994F|nr:4-hydroxy-3-methylbut-2-en-1-yl diphosphate synthase [Candidatus Izimaplasma bacterium HR1]
MTRKNTKLIKVRDVLIGNKNKIVIQTMTTTKTSNIEETIRQINTLATAGADIVRLAIFDESDADAIKEIKRQTNVPLVADIHFNYRFALTCIANGIDKIRINPGNIGSEDRIKRVVDACKKKQIPIRIGINGGSLEKHIIEKYGVTAEGMLESAKYHVSLLEKYKFYDIVLSLKSSHIDKTVEAYRLASKEFDYPLHLGVTEAGTKFGGTIKSSIGLGILLYEGIGDTIRVSLSADPIEEVKVAKELLSSLGLYTKARLISCPTCGRLQYKMFDLVNKVEAYLEDKEYDLTVAVMGCAVNGPGEAKAADIGIAGGRNGGLIFVNGETKRKVNEEDMYDELIKEIENYPKK